MLQMVKKLRMRLEMIYSLLKIFNSSWRKNKENEKGLNERSKKRGRKLKKNNGELQGRSGEGREGREKGTMI